MHAAYECTHCRVYTCVVIVIRTAAPRLVLAAHYSAVVKVVTRVARRETRSTSCVTAANTVRRFARYVS